MSMLRPLDATATRLLPTVDQMVASLRPDEPMQCLRPDTIRAAARGFVSRFAGDTLYAVKCNPDPSVLQALWQGGVRHFDCASAAEVALVRGLFAEAEIHFMHPVKARPAIRAAYREHGVRDFVLDAASELDKILHETGHAADLGLVVRLALPRGGAMYDLSGKFGATPEAAVALLRAARPHARRLGLSFHVGSQCLDPLAWRQAIALAGQVMDQAGVAVELLDVGGGFPVRYPDIEPPPLAAFLHEIEASAATLRRPGLRLWAEPGRVLVAEGMSVVVQVQMRRDTALFVNDGVYGSLSDAGAPGFRFPARRIAAAAPAHPAGEVVGYTLFGPTCDSADMMKGPFLLPGDVAEGDWIEIGQLGAYGACLRTGFNGFDRVLQVEVGDASMLPARADEARDEPSFAAAA